MQRPFSLDKSIPRPEIITNINQKAPVDTSFLPITLKTVVDLVPATAAHVLYFISRYKRLQNGAGSERNHGHARSSTLDVPHVHSRQPGSRIQAKMVPLPPVPLKSLPHSHDASTSCPLYLSQRQGVHDPRAVNRPRSVVSTSRCKGAKMWTLLQNLCPGPLCHETTPKPHLPRQTTSAY